MAVGDDLSAGLSALTWILTVTSTIVVSLRLYVRFGIRKGRWLSLDDACVLFTFCLNIVNSIFVTLAAHWGLGKHVQVLYATPQNIVYSIKWGFLAEGPAIIGRGSARIAFAILLLGLTPPSIKKRRILWSIIAFQFFADIGATIITYIQCQPIQKYWDQSVPGRCWDPHVQEYVGFTVSSIASAVDVTLALYSASLFWNLNMRWQQKLYLSSIMGLGIVASIASIGKTVNLKRLTETHDFTFALAQTALWWTSELNLVLIAASIPTLSPILQSTKASSSTNSRFGPSGQILINTFNLRKRMNNKTGTTDSEVQFVRLEEEEIAQSARQH